VAGILHESQRVGSDLLISAALLQRLDRCMPFQYNLHLGFNLPGHRYPATLFRVAAAPVAEAMPEPTALAAPANLTHQSGFAGS
jgi:hypothetical protein